MALSYKNLSTDTIMEENRFLNYFSGNMLYSQNNIVMLTFVLMIDPQQWALQADIWSRQVMLFRSDFDFKRFLGSDYELWQQKLHLTFIYTKLKAIFYGSKANFTHEWPKDTVNFPGNVLLAHCLRDGVYQFHIEDQQPMNLYISLKLEDTFEVSTKGIFEAYPELKQGLSISGNNFSYVNVMCESILRGLSNGRDFLMSRNNKNRSMNMYELYSYDDENVSKFLKKDSNPFANSCLSTDFKEFKLIIPRDNTSPKTIKFNESLFLSRALGFTCDDLPSFEGNNVYKVIKRDYYEDVFTKDEVYSITGIKSDMVPYTNDEILDYLNLNYDDNGKIIRVEVERGGPFRKK